MFIEICLQSKTLPTHIALVWFFGDVWQGFISDGMRLINFGIGHSTSVVVVLVVHVVVDRLVCVHCHFDFYFG